MKPKIYLETTIPSYLTAWPSSDLIKAAMRGNIENVCRQMGYNPPIICTPNELAEV